MIDPIITSYILTTNMYSHLIECPVHNTYNKAAFKLERESDVARLSNQKLAQESTCCAFGTNVK